MAKSRFIKLIAQEINLADAFAQNPHPHTEHTYQWLLNFQQREAGCEHQLWPVWATTWATASLGGILIFLPRVHQLHIKQSEHENIYHCHLHKMFLFHILLSLLLCLYFWYLFFNWNALQLLLCLFLLYAIQCLYAYAHVKSLPAFTTFLLSLTFFGSITSKGSVSCALLCQVSSSTFNTKVWWDGKHLYQLLDR